MKVNFKTPIAPSLGITRLDGPLVGIELEYEQCKAGHLSADLYRKWWTLDIDHSLRNGGIEFISKPLKPSQLMPATLCVTKVLGEAGGVINKRCGVHVHLNVSDLTFEQLWNITTYYTLIEAMVFKEFADGREENHFCVPTYANSVLQRQFYDDAISLHRGIQKRTKRPGPSALGGSVIAPKQLLPLRILATPKYAAMNVNSLPKFGTLEFRQMRGSRDMLKVRKWARFLLNLREVALTYDNAEDILFEYEANGFDNLCGDLKLNISEDILPEDIIDCIDGAFTMVGHRPTKHQDLNWEIA